MPQGRYQNLHTLAPGRLLTADETPFYSI